MFGRKQAVSTPLRVTDPDWPATLAALRVRLAATPKDDALLRGILALIEANVRTELDPLTAPGLDEAEVNRLRGRLGMCLDLKAEIEKLHREAQQEAMKKA